VLTVTSDIGTTQRLEQFLIDETRVRYRTLMSLEPSVDGPV